MARLGKNFIAGLGFVLLSACGPELIEKPIDLVWPNPPGTPQVKYLRSLSQADDFDSGRSWLEALVPKKTAWALKSPYGVTTDHQGKIYVTDKEQGGVWVFEPNDKKVSFLGAVGSVKLSQPVGISVGASGVVFVSDIGLKRIFGFNSEGKLVLALGQKDEFDTPSGLAVDLPSARLYVADTRKHKVRVYNSNDGTFLFEFGQAGRKDGEFNFPTNLFIRNGEIYVSDSVNSRIQIFALNGKFLKKFGAGESGPVKFARPRGVAVDSEGRIYVADALLNNLQVFDGEGKLLFRIGASGDGPGSFALPAGVHIDEEDRIYVVDSFNRRIQLFQSLEKSRIAKSR